MSALAKEAATTPIPVQLSDTEFTTFIFVHLLDKAYANGVRVAKKAFHKIEERLERHVSLPKYCVRIQPQGG